MIRQLMRRGFALQSLPKQCGDFVIGSCAAQCGPQVDFQIRQQAGPEPAVRCQADPVTTVAITAGNRCNKSIHTLIGCRLQIARRTAAMRGLLGRGQIAATQSAQTFGDRSHCHPRPHPALMRRHIFDKPDDDRRITDHFAKKSQIFLADRVSQDHIELDRRQTGLRSRSVHESGQVRPCPG